jgi:hypothetical protein
MNNQYLAKSASQDIFFFNGILIQIAKDVKDSVIHAQKLMFVKVAALVDFTLLAGNASALVANIMTISV